MIFGCARVWSLLVNNEQVPPTRLSVKTKKTTKPYASTLDTCPPLQDFKMSHGKAWLRMYAEKGYAGLTVADRAKLSHIFNIVDADLSKPIVDQRFIHDMVVLGFTKDAIREFGARPETRLSLDSLDADFAFSMKQAEAKYSMDVSRIPFNRMKGALEVVRAEDPDAPLHIRKDVFLMFYYLMLMSEEGWQPLVQQFQCNQWPYCERPKNDMIFTRTAFILALIQDFCDEREYVHRPRRSQVRKEMDAAIILGEPWIVRARHTMKMPDPLGEKGVWSPITTDVWKRSWLIEHRLWRGLPAKDLASTTPTTFDWFQIPVALGGKIIKFPELRQA